MDIRFSPPEHVSILVIDSGGHDVSELFVPLFRNASYACIEPKKLGRHITLSVILRTFYYSLLTRSILVGYITALVRSIRPSIVLTFVDNSLLFQRLARLHKNKGPRFLAIQNGVRMLARDNPKGTPQVYHSEFACLGQHDVEQYKRHGAQVDYFYPIGSLRDSYYRERQPRPPAIKHFDLCLISQIKPQHYKAYPQTMRSLTLLAQYLKRFCEAHGTRLCVAARRHPETNARLFEWEKSWFHEHIGAWAEVIPNAPGEYTSYALVDQSRVSLAQHTTLLHEGFGRGNRVMSCNFTGDPQYDFPVEGPWKLNTPDYEAFEAQLLRLLKMSDDEYSRQAGRWPQYLIGYNPAAPTHHFLQQLIADATQGLPLYNPHLSN